VTHMATYLKCGDTQEKPIARVKAVAECLMTNLSESVGSGGRFAPAFLSYNKLMVL
jgi:hypothetical protein